MLSETWLDNDECVSIPNFDCCVQFKRPGRRAAGVAIYRKQENSHVVTPHMNITYRQTSGLGIVSNDIGGHIEDAPETLNALKILETFDLPTPTAVDISLTVVEV
ncbi:uncharacterized protein TNCV_621971 [Trichonephila clavipes]|nr:uncharacterized protein TNCV_621971 [Trichonephila clavipes]